MVEVTGHLKATNGDCRWEGHESCRTSMVEIHGTKAAKPRKSAAPGWTPIQALEGRKKLAQDVFLIHYNPVSAQFAPQPFRAHDAAHAPFPKITTFSQGLLNL